MDALVQGTASAKQTLAKLDDARSSWECGC